MARVSIRFVFVTVALVCVWLATESSRARKQQQAVQLARRFGGHVVLVERFDRPALNPLAMVPNWLRGSLDDYFSQPARIDLSARYAQQLIDADLEFIKLVPTLRQLNLNDNASITDDALRHCGALTGLRTLTLRRTRVEGSGLKHLRRARRLYGLDLGQTCVPNSGLSEIAQFVNLSWLLLDHTQISKLDASQMSELDELRMLAINDTQIGDDSLSAVGECRNLRRLCLLGSNVTADGIAKLRESLPDCRIVWRPERRIVLNKIRDLDGRVVLQHADVLPSEMPYKTRAEFADVVELSVHSSFFSDDDLRMLDSFRELRRLDVSESQVSDRGIETLRHLRKLESVKLSNNLNVTDASLGGLAELPALKSLSLRNTSVSDEGLARLKNASQLTTLHVHSQLITDAGVIHLGALKKLKVLSLDFNPSLAGLQFASLSELTQLEELSLSNTRVTDRSVQGLSKLTQLKFLSVGGTNLTQAGVAKLRANLPSTRVMHWPQPGSN